MKAAKAKVKEIASFGRLLFHFSFSLPLFPMSSFIPIFVRWLATEFECAVCMFISFKFCATTKLNRFYSGDPVGLIRNAGEKISSISHPFLESIFNFWLVILSATFSFSLAFFIYSMEYECLVCVCAYIVDENDNDDDGDEDDLDYISIPIFAVGFIPKKIKPFKKETKP